MAAYVFDVESNGLLDVADKIHCLSFTNIDTGTTGSLVTYAAMVEFLSQENLTIIGHNIIRYDIPLLEKILNIKIKAELIDTLPLSWYLFPDRVTHGLEEWGVDFGIPKPKIVDWESLKLSDYVHRCEEDVKINLKLFLKQWDLLIKIYDTGKQGDNPKTLAMKLVKYLGYKMECAREQEEVRWKLDVEKTEKNLIYFQETFDEKKNALSSVMPEKINYKKVKKPKKLTKVNGDYSIRGKFWLDLLEDLGLPDNYIQDLTIEKSREPGNPTSPAQLKSWLYELGWEPITFKYEKKDNGSFRKIEQVSLPRGQGLCPSVLDIIKKHPQLEPLDSLYVVKHRLGLLKGFVRDVSEDGYVRAKVSGLTNTLRFKHSIVVNLPKSTGKGDFRDGSYIRGCLIAPEGQILCGSDMSSLEDRTKQHFMHYFDPKYVKSMQVPDFDPHLNLAEFAYEMTKGQIGVSKEDSAWYKSFDSNFGVTHTQEEEERYSLIDKQRSTFKTVNYGAVYGVGAATMSRSSNMNMQECAVLLKVYWERNFSVKVIASNCIVKKVGKQFWLYNPVSKLWYSLRALKDRFSTLNQGKIGALTKSA